MSMKKLAIGCGVVVVLLSVTVGVGLFIAAHKAASYIRDSGVVESIQTLGKGVTNNAPFAAPASGELTAEMVKRFVAVQEAMVAKLGTRFNELAAMQDEMLRRQRAEHRHSTSSEDFKNVTSGMGFILQAQGAWVDALNQQRFSMDEYQWVRARVYAAAGLELVELGTRNLQEALKEGNVVTHPVARAGDPLSQRNRELVAPFIPRLKNSAALAFFGL
jgi:hypothetical protein